MNSAGYHVLPRVYDRWQETYGGDFTSVILPRLLASIRRFRIPVSTFLDVGCGTGTLALAMARRGWRVWGVDASAEMVAVAERKRDEAGLKATFMRQDMRTLRAARPVRLVTSMFDTLNHVESSQELLATFQAVHSALLPGGYFMFDVNNEHCYRTLWTQDEEIQHEDFTLLLENSFDATSGKARSRVTLTPRTGEPVSEVVGGGALTGDRGARAPGACGVPRKPLGRLRVSGCPRGRGAENVVACPAPPKHQASDV